MNKAYIYLIVMLSVFTITFILSIIISVYAIKHTKGDVRARKKDDNYQQEVPIERKDGLFAKPQNLPRENTLSNNAYVNYMQHYFPSPQNSDSTETYNPQYFERGNNTFNDDKDKERKIMSRK